MPVGGRAAGALSTFTANTGGPAGCGAGGTGGAGGATGAPGRLTVLVRCSKAPAATNTAKDSSSVVVRASTRSHTPSTGSAAHPARKGPANELLGSAYQSLDGSAATRPAGTCATAA